ncbi:MAG: 1,4-alpha-glucan branching protein GlgB [Aestuariivirga sp.]
MAKGLLPKAELDALVDGMHGNPFAVLGLHKSGKNYVARALVHGAEKVTATSLTGEKLGELKLIHPAGVFEGPVKVKNQQPLRYEAKNKGGEWSFADPYSFGPVLGPMDDYYVAQGTHLRLYDKFGAHIIDHEGATGTHFALWAPNAKRVSVIGDFNAWDGRRHVMRLRQGTGVWEIFIPGVGEGAKYKYEIIGQSGDRLPLKSDPYGFGAELRPNTASRVSKIDNFKWTDSAYLTSRAEGDWRRKPMSIYEVHLGSWRKKDGAEFLSYDDLARDLVGYASDMGYTHIELLPISEHPFDPSWGYQPTGLYAPTSRFGDPAGFARFVDAAHVAGIGVILDWVPAHFPTDEFGLGRFDGTALYEHADPRKGFHPDWHTLIYNFGRTEVQSFLINNALFWLEKYHIDGLRVDAVASMLYLDYSRKAGEWIPNEQGGNENTEAIAFLRRMNEVCYAAHPGVVTIAEESTAFPGVSQPVYNGGLGFGFKWNMGFMHDTLEYMSRDPVHRRHHHNELTFGLLYAFSENFVLPLSHDEVVHGKGSLLKKMGGDDWAKFASLRAFYTFMWAYPGKKLLFMGQEFAPWEEWSEGKSLDWHLLDHLPHKGIQNLIRDLNKLYTSLPALSGRDCEGEGFQWLIADDHENSVFAWVRWAGDAPPVALIANFTPVPREGYGVPMPRAGRWAERLNSDAPVYGGTGVGNGGVVIADEQNGQARAILTLPPMASLILEYTGP